MENKENQNNIAEFAKAFIAAQKEMTNAAKDSKNPHFRSTYADLTSVRDACVPYLLKHNIGVLQATIDASDGKKYIETIFLHESGERVSSRTEIICKDPTNPQAQGSGITYARRYGLQALACIAADDDDGNQAAGTTPPKPIIMKDFKITTTNTALYPLFEKGNFERCELEMGNNQTMIYYQKSLSEQAYAQAVKKLEVYKPTYDDISGMWIVGQEQFEEKVTNNK